MPPSALPFSVGTPALWATSASPLQSITILARMAVRPLLLSVMTPRIVSFSTSAPAKKV